MMNQRSSNEKQTNMYGTRLQVEVVPQPEGAEDQIYGIYTADMRLCPPSVQEDGITNSEKTYIYIYIYIYIYS